MRDSLKFSILILCKITLILASEKCETNSNCLRKCCAENELFDLSKSPPKCEPNSGTPFREIVATSVYQIIHGKDCQEEMMKVPLDNVDLPFKLEKNKVIWEGGTYDYTNSCIDVFENRAIAVICTLADEEQRILSVTGTEIFIYLGTLLEKRKSVWHF